MSSGLRTAILSSEAPEVFYRTLARRSLVLTALLLVLLASASLAGPAPRNIILLIGDGMGVGPICAARIAGPGPHGQLTIDTLPVTGLIMTSPATGLVADSAAAGTALATGSKTNNGMISVDPDGNRLTSILELARDMGKATGIISTKFITDATPAVFTAHVGSRGERTEIASQMLASGVDVILGGGKQYFISKTSEDGLREDGRDLLADAAKNGYEVFDTAEAMQASKASRMIGLFAKDAMKNQRPEPTIAEMTAKAISALSRNSKGFFLMSEGGQIDSEAHGNNAEGVVKQMTDFDEAVRVALDFARKDGNTLVIATADHDTGGLAPTDEDKSSPIKFKPGWVSGGHTANMVPLYAFGPGAELFTGTHENTYIPSTFAQLWGRSLK